MLSGVQIKMARAALGWGVRDLAKKTKLSTTTIVNAESGGDVKISTLNKIQKALEAQDIVFIENGCVCPPKSDET